MRRFLITCTVSSQPPDMSMCESVGWYFTEWTLILWPFITSLLSLKHWNPHRIVYMQLSNLQKIALFSQEEGLTNFGLDLSCLLLAPLEICIYFHRLKHLLQTDVEPGASQSAAFDDNCLAFALVLTARTRRHLHGSNCPESCSGHSQGIPVIVPVHSLLNLLANT